MCSPKEYHQKKIAEMVCLRRKTPLKPPHRPFLKKGGVSKTPHAIGFLRNPPHPLNGIFKRMNFKETLGKTHCGKA